MLSLTWQLYCKITNSKTRRSKSLSKKMGVSLYCKKYMTDYVTSEINEIVQHGGGEERLMSNTMIDIFKQFKNS